MAPSAVLIADADRELRNVYGRFFAHQGWGVRTCGGSVECLAQLRRFLPQLVILDRTLLWGGADGLLAVMRDDPYFTRVPVILTSTEASSGNLAGFVSPPVVQVLYKPFSLRTMLEIVRLRLEKQEPVAS